MSSCFKQQLEKHLKRCNAKPRDPPPYIIRGFNVETTEFKPTRVTLGDLSDEYLVSLIQKIDQIHEEFITIREFVGTHPVLTEELQRPDLGSLSLKHLNQNSSLLALMDTKSLLNDDTCFIEMGAGKGALTYWLSKATANLKGCSFALIDRASHRHKNENKLRTSTLEPTRIRADIADLCLRRVSALKGTKNVVIVSKHLCGAATDLALRCVSNCIKQETQETCQWEMRGLVMAVCCHHRCDWNTFVGKSFFQDVGLNDDDFTAMCVLSSWATCGSGRSRDPQAQKQQSTKSQIENKHKDRYDKLNLPQEVRETIGRKCKHVIDHARNKYLKSVGFNSEILFYVKPSVTLENVAIISTQVLD